jgi:hypothetical protein
MMSVSPPGHKTAGDGFEPSPSGFRARRSAAEIPRHRAVAREGVDPHARWARPSQDRVSTLPPPGYRKIPSRHMQPWKGFEPLISTVRAWRPLRWSARVSVIEWPRWESNPQHLSF